MKLQPTTPSGQPQTLQVAETFFSTTDHRGVITSGNQVFSRASGYTIDELIGQPHNVIRHPEMPRQVFRLLWETVQAGKSFMGYVKNHAKNGNHYWVFAVVVPIPKGYLSVRIKPTSPLLEPVERIYQRLAEREASAIANGQSESQAADSSAELLRAEINQLGFANYEAFSHHALNTEIKSRDDEIARQSLRLFPRELVADRQNEGEEQLRQLFDQARSVYESINGLFASLDTFIAVCRTIGERKNAVQAISQDFRLNALNVHIAAHPLGAEGITVGTVARLLNGHAQDLSRNVDVLADHIIRTTATVANIASNLSVARIQIEMLLSFLAEIEASHHEHNEMQKLEVMTDDLRTGFTTTVEHAFGAVAELQQLLPAVLDTKERLRKDIVYLQAAQISGLTEISRLEAIDSLHTTFTGLRGQIESGKAELQQLDQVIDHLSELTNRTPPQIDAIRQSMQQMHPRRSKPSRLPRT